MPWFVRAKSSEIRSSGVRSCDATRCACLVKVGQSRVLEKSSYMLLNSAIIYLPTQCFAVLIASALFSLVIFPMLSTRTKQVFTYGRRNKRIINDRDDLFDVPDTKNSSAPNGSKRLDHQIVALATPLARREKGAGKKRNIVVSPSSTGSPPLSSHNFPKRRRENYQALSSIKPRHSPSSSRPPLSSHSVNMSQRSPLTGRKKMTKLSGSRAALLPQSPDVNMDIFVIDETGRRVSQERRVSKTNVKVNQRTILHRGPAMHTATGAIVVSDSDDSDGSSKFKRRAKRWPKVLSSSEEEFESPIRSASSLNSPRPNTTGVNPAETPVAKDLSKPPISHYSSRPTSVTIPKANFRVEIISRRPPALLRGQQQGVTLHDSPPQPLPTKHRQLTPIRRKGPTFPRLPPSPSTITDLDIDLADLTLSSIPTEDHALPDQPPHLIPLLDECGQDAPVEFSAFIEAFPVHPIVRPSCSGRAAFQKIGEASYSEVFGIGDVVLKIIPIHNEERPDETDAETPAPSDARDVLKEIIVTRALGETCDGFVSLLKTYVVRGKYPSLLLDLWDEYNQTKGSESVRPGAIHRVSKPHLSLNLTRHVGLVTGVRYNRVAQWRPGFGGILVQPTSQDWLETSL